MENITKSKRKRIKFVRYNSEHLDKLSSNWRKSKGLHNKTRLKKKGHKKSPSIGYGTPSKVKGLYNSQFNYKMINSEKDLDNFNGENVILSRTIGLKEKIRLINKIKSMNLKILNIK